MFIPNNVGCLGRERKMGNDHCLDHALSARIRPPAGPRSARWLVAISRLSRCIPESLGPRVAIWRQGDMERLSDHSADFQHSSNGAEPVDS